MNYKVKVTIDGRVYNLSTDSADGYTERVAAYVDREIAQVTQQLHASTVNAATMTAMNIADRYFREHMAAEELRQELEKVKAQSQMSAEVQKELDSLRNQVALLTKERDNYQSQLNQTADLRAQLKDAQEQCVKLRREIVRMGKGG